MTTAAHEQWRPTLLLTRSFVADYARNPVNLIVLILVPLAFVVVAAESLANAMELLGGQIGPALETTTAGWAAGFLSSLAMYFQVRSARAADRRLLLAGLPQARLIAARAGTGLLLAGLASAVALVAWRCVPVSTTRPGSSSARSCSRSFIWRSAHLSVW
jgi:hypothetical protein